MVHEIPGTTLQVKPHLICSCGQAHRDQELIEQRIKERAERRDRSRSGPLAGGAMESLANLSLDDEEANRPLPKPYASCTKACTVRSRVGGFWRSHVEHGEINVEYWLYIDQEAETHYEDDTPLLSWETDSFEHPSEHTVPLWKKGLLIIRIEDRMPVNFNPGNLPDRKSGQEIRVVERFLHARCKINGDEEGWSERFKFTEDVVAK